MDVNWGGEGLLRYDWPGNVQELRNAMAQAAISRKLKVYRMETEESAYYS